MAHPRTFRSRAPRRKTTWIGGAGGTGVTSLTATGSSLLGGAFTPATDQVTLVRMRGLFDAYLNGPTTSDGDGFFGAVGVGLATKAAVDAGIGSVPTPITEELWDGWIWHSFFSCHQGDTTFGGGSERHQRIIVDSKAMRIVNSEMRIYAAVQVVEIGAGAMDVFFDTRFLLKLS